MRVPLRYNIDITDGSVRVIFLGDEVIVSPSEAWSSRALRYVCFGYFRSGANDSTIGGTHGQIEQSTLIR